MAAGQAATGELVVHPGHRRRGLGRALLAQLQAEAARLDPAGRAGQSRGSALRVWAHGDLPAARELAAAAGLTRSRVLWQMRRPLAGQLGEPAYPAGITIRAFRPGTDEQAWLAVNARAFAHHPEQGSWTLTDMLLREQEPWFDPAGFFLAERDGRLAGFHWTKIHASQPPAGEVYVVGVDPGEQGTGLGRALTLTGLRYLRSRGLPAVMLYADEDNAAAVRMYTALGFAHVSSDVMFAAAAPQAG